MKTGMYSLCLLFLLSSSMDILAASRPSYNSKHKRTLQQTTYSPASNSRQPRAPLKKSYWKTGEHSGEPKVVIYRNSQVAHFYFGSQKVGQSPVSTGRKGHETPSGTFTVTQKSRDHYSNLFGSFVSSSGKFMGEANAGQTPPSGARYRPAPMPYFMRLTDSGIGMHAGYVPGVPASHGCIRLPRDMARTFFQNLPMGSTVVIK